MVLLLFSCVWLFVTPWTAECQDSPSFTISWNLLKLMSIESLMPSNHPILCRPLLLLASIFPSSGSFPMIWLFTSGGQSIGVSASASVLPMNIQGLFHLGLTGWSPGCPRDSQESSPTPQLKSINPLALCLLFPGRLQSISSSHQIDCNLPGSSVRGILQATILEWVATTSSRGSSQLRDWTQISYASCTGRQVLYHWHHLGSIQSCFPLGLTGLISLQSKGLSKVFSRTTVQKHQFFSAQPSSWSSSHIHRWLLAIPKLWLYRTLLAKWYLCFLICCLGLLQLFFQGACVGY